MDINKISQIALEIVKDSQSNLALSLYNELQSGKMLRSKLVLSIINTKKAHKLCAIIELIQSASLLHDDVIDESDTRRGVPSINAKFGNKNAIMLGDFLYSSAFHELSKFDSKIAQSLSLAVARLSIGEMEDVDLEKEFNDNEEKYLKMIENKSASLIASSAECAALLLGADNFREYYDYGLNLGLAFQIIDDILDITQDTKTLGKPSLSDFASGKTTLPYIYLYHSLNDADKEYVKSLFKKELDSEDREKLLHLLKIKAIDRARQKARFYANIALQKANSINNQKLAKIIASMIERDF